MDFKDYGSVSDEIFFCTPEQKISMLMLVGLSLNTKDAPGRSLRSGINQSTVRDQPVKHQSACYPCFKGLGVCGVVNPSCSRNSFSPLSGLNQSCVYPCQVVFSYSSYPVVSYTNTGDPAVTTQVVSLMCRIRYRILCDRHITYVSVFRFLRIFQFFRVCFFFFAITEEDTPDFVL